MEGVGQERSCWRAAMNQPWFWDDDASEVLPEWRIMYFNFWYLLYLSKYSSMDTGHFFLLIEHRNTFSCFTSLLSEIELLIMWANSFWSLRQPVVASYLTLKLNSIIKVLFQTYESGEFFHLTPLLLEVATATIRIGFLLLPLSTVLTDSFWGKQIIFEQKITQISMKSGFI